MKVYSIGRNEDCTIVLDNPMVSRRHALLKVYPTGKMEIVGLGTNGTFVNGNKLKPNVPYSVKRSDVISFAHAKQLDWDLVENPVWWLKYALYGLVAIIVLGLAYAMIDHWLIKKPKADERIEQLETPQGPGGQSGTKAKEQKSDQKTIDKAPDATSTAKGAEATKSEEGEAELSDSRFFPVKKQTVKPEKRIEKADVKKNENADKAKGKKDNAQDKKQDKKQDEKQGKKQDKKSEQNNNNQGFYL